MSQIDFRIFASTSDPGRLQRLLDFFDLQMDDPYPHIEVKVGTNKGRPVYQPVQEYLKEVQENGHSTQGSTNRT